MTTTNTFVRPSASLVPETIKLSPIDQFTNRVYTPLLLVFKLDEALRDVICHDLKLGLANLINDIPFLAGNVILEDEESGNLQIDIPEDPGVMFKVKEMLDSAKGSMLDFDALEKAAFSSSFFDPSEIGPIDFVPEPVAPVLAVQANFIRGGLVLASYIHHSTTDALGLMAIWKRWSRYVSTAAASCAVTASEPFPEETLDRSALFPDYGTWRKLHDFPGFVKEGESTSIRAPEAKQKNHLLVNQPAKLTIAHWYISPSNLQALEETAKPADSVGGSLTSSCVLAGFLWKHCVRAKRLEQRGIETVSIFVRCNIRRRIDPPLHQQFLGNAVVHCEAKVPLAELVSSELIPSEPGSLYHIASLVSGCIEWYTSDNIWDLVSALSTTPRFGDTEPVMNLFSESVFKITDVSAVPLHSSHWGPRMGNPCAIRLPGIFVLDGEAIILPRLPDGGIEFSTHLSIDALEELKADAEFAKHVQFRCS